MRKMFFFVVYFMIFFLAAAICYSNVIRHVDNVMCTSLQLNILLHDKQKKTLFLNFAKSRIMSCQSFLDTTATTPEARTLFFLDKYTQANATCINSDNSELCQALTACSECMTQANAVRCFDTDGKHLPCSDPAAVRLNDMPGKLTDAGKILATYDHLLYCSAKPVDPAPMLEPWAIALIAIAAVLLVIGVPCIVYFMTKAEYSSAMNRASRKTMDQYTRINY